MAYLPYVPKRGRMLNPWLLCYGILKRKRSEVLVYYTLLWCWMYRSIDVVKNIESHLSQVSKTHFLRQTTMPAPKCLRSMELVLCKYKCVYSSRAFVPSFCRKRIDRYEHKFSKSVRRIVSHFHHQNFQLEVPIWTCIEVRVTTVLRTRKRKW